MVATIGKIVRRSLAATCWGTALWVVVMLTGAAPAAETVTIGNANTASDVGFYLAESKGYFRDEDINAQLSSFPSAAQMIAPLGTGRLDVGGGTVAAGLYNAVESGVKIRIVADKGSIAEGYETSTLIVRKDLVDSGRYKSLSDLKGMTVATASKGAGSESQLNEALKKGGLKFTDVNVVYLGFPAMYAAFANRGIDACITAEPTMTRMIRTGLAVRGSPDIIYPGQQAAVILYAESFADKRTQVARKFMTAYLRAIRYYNDALVDGHLAGPKGEEIVSILTRYTEIKDRTIYESVTPFFASPDGKVNIETLRNDITFYQSRGLVGPNMRVEDVVDASFAADAAKALGPYVKTR